MPSDAKHLTFLVKGIVDIGKAQNLAEVQALTKMLVRYIELERITESLTPDRVRLKLTAWNGVHNKINLIKEVRTATGLGLKETKDLCELGGIIPKEFETADALKLKSTIELLGGTVDLIGGSEMLNILHGD